MLGLCPLLLAALLAARGEKGGSEAVRMGCCEGWEETGFAGAGAEGQAGSFSREKTMVILEESGRVSFAVGARQGDFMTEPNSFAYEEDCRTSR